MRFNILFLKVLLALCIEEGNGFFTNIEKELNLTCNVHNLPCLDQNEWWGPISLKGREDTSIRPFRVTFDHNMIYDLRTRLLNHRYLIPPLEGTSSEYGINTIILKQWIQYWIYSYPFKERENYINRYPMYKTNIQGLDIFFVWIKPEVTPGKKRVPLLLLHGWPGSILEFYEAIPLLTKSSKTRDFVLELIIPGLPGFGYSDAAVRPGMGAAEAGVIFKNLMKRLGFRKFYIQGGDFGSIVCAQMATMYPKDILGFHSNWPAIMHPVARLMHTFGAVYPPLIVKPNLAGRMYPLWDVFSFLMENSGYLHEQATKPDTLGVGTGDSAVGLLAYNLEKFLFGLALEVSKERIMDQIMMYWAPNSVTTSYRFYAEFFNKREFRLGLHLIPTNVPFWSIHAKREINYDPPSLLRVKFPNLVNSTAIPYGGHFLAFETPEVFADDVLRAMKKFRRREYAVSRATEVEIVDEQNFNFELFWDAIVYVKENPDAWFVRVFLTFAAQALVRIFKGIFKLEYLLNEYR